MSMIPCPGCGLPREESQVGVVPCPVCDTASTTAAVLERSATAAPPSHDPTANLPADVSQLHAAHPVANANPNVLSWIAVFVVGVGIGVGGVLGWQTAFRADSSNKDASREAAQVVAQPPTPTRVTGIEEAPPPHPTKPPVNDTAPPTPQTQSEPKPEPQPKPLFAPPGRAIVIELNQPDAVYTVPFSMRSGEYVVLRGKVKTLRVDGLDGGAILDASGLRVESASVAGKIDGRSVFKLNAPGGAVMVSASVAGKSSVEIKAPGGSVRFLSDRAQIEGGSTVSITARHVELRGDVNGIATKVAVNIPGNGSLKVAAIRGLATVEYRVTGDGTPEVIASTVSPTATFHRLD